ncbi:MAG: EF-hand domain-containing protein [Candidatus Sericytochromatia bacterium]|nr:EF-hand domain-containing protein [Candidatus Sericytochromatia bacterium]
MRPSTFRSKRSICLVAFVSVLALSGCGVQPTSLAVDRSAAIAEAEATNTLMKGLARIHQAIFAKLDKDANKAIDEYEAGPNLTMDDFRKADRNRNGKLTFSEFKSYATTHLFFFRDTPKAFTERVRGALKRAFDRLDHSPRDGMLANRELSNRDLQRLGLSFEYARLGITVKVAKVSDAAFTAADKVADGKLGQAEFEDLYVECVIEALGGTPGGGSAPPAEDPNVPPVPPAPPAEDPALAPGEPPVAPPAPPAAPVPAPPGKKRP